MTEFFNLFFSFWSRILSLLDYFKFEIYGYSVSILGVLVALLIIGLTISITWRGAKT